MTSPRRLEILTYLHSFDPGGVERVALRLCDAWQAQGAGVKVLMGRCDGRAREQAQALDYVVYSSGVVGTARFETLWMIYCLWRRVRAVRPDVIFCAGNTYTVVAVALRLLLGRSCPPVVAKVSNLLDRRDMPLFSRPLYRLWLRVQGRWIHHWVAIAPALKDEVSTLMRVPAGRIAAIGDPAICAAEADALFERRRAGTRERPGRLFLSAGRLARQKRFDLLLQAFHRGARPADRLVIIGDGPLRARLLRQALRLGLRGRVQLPGHCLDPGSWLAKADAFILVSDYEGLPAVLLEALAAGLPVISTKSSPGVAELLGHGALGRLVEPGDLEGLAEALAGEIAPQDADAARRQAAAFRIEEAGPAWLAILEGAASAIRLHVRQTLKEAVSGG
jgi:glycosyltransferase involved in cell wall biosynthesis